MARRNKVNYKPIDITFPTTEWVSNIHLWLIASVQFVQEVMGELSNFDTFSMGELMAKTNPNFMSFIDEIVVVDDAFIELVHPVSTLLPAEMPYNLFDDMAKTVKDLYTQMTFVMDEIHDKCSVFRAETQTVLATDKTTWDKWFKQFYNLTWDASSSFYGAVRAFCEYKTQDMTIHIAATCQPRNFEVLWTGWAEEHAHSYVQADLETMVCIGCGHELDLTTGKTKNMEISV